MRTILLFLALLITTSSAFAQRGNNKTTKQAEQKEIVQHLKLYPTRATTYVNVYVEYEQPTDFTLTIVATPLNNERKWLLKAKTSYQQSIDVTQLPAGEYTITLSGGGVFEKAGFTVSR